MQVFYPKISSLIIEGINPIALLILLGLTYLLSGTKGSRSVTVVEKEINLNETHENTTYFHLHTHALCDAGLDISTNNTSTNG